MGAFKEFARNAFPGPFRALRDAKDRVVIEWRVLRHMSPADIRRLVAPRRDLWRTDLPVQQVRRATVGVRLPDALLAMTPRPAEGGHAVYLSPEQWLAGPLRDLARDYPGDAGIKVLRTTGGAADGQYLHGDGHSRIQRMALHGHPQLHLVAATLAIEGLGPRPYDLLEIEAEDGVHVAYVGRHVEGRVPDAGEWRRGMAELSALGARDLLTVAAPDGMANDDFREPDCNGNAFVDADGNFLYVDFQNFLLGDYTKFLTELALAAAESSHFGDKSVIRGGRYLYQTVPGLDLPAKRSVGNRVVVLRELLRQAGCDLAGRRVLDIGCNIGMMLASYLRMGAAWCHGWDMPHVVPHTERLLLAVGCTRFSLTGARLESGRPLPDDLPIFVRDGEPVVVSYLAVRGHLGWLDALATLRWTHMIYEGHEGEDEATTRAHIADLAQRVPCRLAALASYRDGDSDPRMVGIVVRA